MAWKVFGDTSNESYPQREVSEKNTFLYTSENTSGDIITEPWLSKSKKLI
jgi:hypothetical protein